MKKFAYTLAEVLIAMAIIGIITAVTLPLSSKFMPDGNKVLYLLTYDSLVQTTNALIADTKTYPLIDAAATVVYRKYPLAHIDSTVTIDNVPYGGNIAKYCQLLAVSFNERNPNCSRDNVLPATPNWDAANISFTAPNGVAFMVYSRRLITMENLEISYESDVYVDVDGIEKGNNCSYNATTCPLPDRFKFEVAPDGQVVASDRKGQEYLRTRHTWRLYNDNIQPPQEKHIVNSFPLEIIVREVD